MPAKVVKWAMWAMWAMFFTFFMAAVSQLPEDFVSLIGEDPEAARANFVALIEQLTAQMPPTEVVKRETTMEGPGGELKLFIYEPPAEAPRPGLLWLHGGGYVIGEGDDPSATPFADAAG